MEKSPSLSVKSEMTKSFDMNNKRKVKMRMIDSPLKQGDVRKIRKDCIRNENDKRRRLQREINTMEKRKVLSLFEDKNQLVHDSSQLELNPALGKPVLTQLKLTSYFNFANNDEKNDSSQD